MMKWWLLLTIASSCGTTATVAYDPTVRMTRPLVNGASATTAAEATDGELEQPTVVVDAISPTVIRFRTEGETIVPLRRHRPITVISHGRGSGRGALIGGLVGVAAGLLFGLPNQSASDPDAVTLGPIVGAVLLGGVGTAVGAVAGALIGEPVTIAAP